MDDNGDHFLCGICKAGFVSSAFLQYLEHMVRHASVARNNKCLICHKGFARTPSLKDHLLHYHAIPLKINPESQPGTDSISGNAMRNGSARCSLFSKKKVNVNKGFVSDLLVQNQPPPMLCLSGPSNVLAPSKSPIVLKEGTENSNTSIDVLTLKDDISVMNSVHQDDHTVVNAVQKDICCANKADLLQEHNRHFINACSYDEVSTLPFAPQPSKELNPDLFLIDSASNDIVLDETLDKSKTLPAVKMKGSSSTPEEIVQACGSDNKTSMLSCENTCNTLAACPMHLDHTKTNFDAAHVNVVGTCESNTISSQNLGCSLSTTTDQRLTNEPVEVPHQIVVNMNYDLRTDINKIDNETDMESHKQNMKLMHESKKNMVKLSEDTVSKRSTAKSQSVAKDNEKSVDFHFFLGTTVINGSSMTYNRLEFRCLHCPFVSAWRPSLVKHMEQVHKDTLDFHKILDIKNVQSKSMCDEKLRQYKVMKLSDYILTNNTGQSKKRMVRSIERQDIPGKYSCPVCFKVFRRIRYMRRHQMSHKTERSHLCDTCGKSFKTRATFLAHHRSHKSQSYHCPQCDFVSNLTGAIHRHRQIHPNGSIVCDICGTAYIDKSTLKKHRRVHDISRPFPCTFPGCTWRFKSEGMKKAHLQSHTTEGQFRCPHCGYRFRHKHHLQRHLSRIHSQGSLTSKLPTDTVLPSSLDVKSGMMRSTVFLPQELPSERDVIKSSTDFTFSSKRSSSDSAGMFFPSVNERLQPSDNVPSNSGIELKLPQSSVDLFVGGKPLEVAVGMEDKSLETSVSIGLENTFDNIPMNNLSNLEYVTENGEIIQVVKSGHVYMRQDHCGNLVEYRITDFRTEDENQSQPVYIIQTDGSVLSTGNQDQTIQLP